MASGRQGRKNTSAFALSAGAVMMLTFTVCTCVCMKGRECARRSTFISRLQEWRGTSFVSDAAVRHHQSDERLTTCALAPPSTPSTAPLQSRISQRCKRTTPNLASS